MSLNIGRDIRRRTAKIARFYRAYHGQLTADNEIVILNNILWDKLCASVIIRSWCMECHIFSFSYFFLWRPFWKCFRSGSASQSFLVSITDSYSICCKLAEKYKFVDLWGGYVMGLPGLQPAKLCRRWYFNSVLGIPPLRLRHSWARASHLKSWFKHRHQSWQKGVYCIYLNLQKLTTVNPIISMISLACTEIYWKAHYWIRLNTNEKIIISLIYTRQDMCIGMCWVGETHIDDSLGKLQPSGPPSNWAVGPGHPCSPCPPVTWSPPKDSQPHRPCREKFQHHVESRWLAP